MLIGHGRGGDLDHAANVCGGGTQRSGSLEKGCFSHPPRVAGRRRHVLVASTGPDIGTSSACHKSDGHRTHSRPRAASRSFSPPTDVDQKKERRLSPRNGGLCPLQSTVQEDVLDTTVHTVGFPFGGWALEPLTAPCQGVADCFTAGPAPGQLPPVGAGQSHRGAAHSPRKQYAGILWAWCLPSDRLLSGDVTAHYVHTQQSRPRSCGIWCGELAFPFQALDRRAIPNPVSPTATRALPRRGESRVLFVPTTMNHGSDYSHASPSPR
jgi:hypothetical protein